MHQEIVERRRWIGENQFLRALNFCMLLPGPEAQQLATYIGWRLHGTLGGIAAGSLFVIPSIKGVFYFTTSTEQGASLTSPWHVPPMMRS